MWVGGCLGQFEHRVHARVGAGEHRGPVITRAGEEDLRDRGAGGRPVAALVLPAQQLAVQPQPGQQLGVELALDRPHRHPAAVRAPVDAVERGDAGEQAGAAAVPLAAGELAELREQQVGRAVHHAGVDHLPAAGALPGQQREHGAQHGGERAAGEVAQQVQRRNRGVEADRAERAADRDIVDVVPGLPGVGAILPPSGQPGVDQPRVTLHQHVGAQAAALHRPRPIPLQEHVGLVAEPGDKLRAARRAQVDREPLLASDELVGGVDLVGHWAPDLDHLGAEVGEHHRGERPRAHRAHVDNRLVEGQRPVEAGRTAAEDSPTCRSLSPRPSPQPRTLAHRTAH